MRQITVPLLAALLLATASVPSAADEPDPLLTVEEVKPVRERWQDCVAAAVKNKIQGSRPVPFILDAAFQSCRRDEIALGNALRRRVGRASSKRIMDSLREFDRAVLTRIIQRMRE
jgi:hypothetical protein